MTPEEFLQAIRRGVDWGPKPFRLQWVSPDGNYAIFTAPGHSYQSGTDTKYGRTSHYLVNLKAQSRSTHGYTLFQDAKIAEIEGRMNKAHLAAMIAKIPSADAGSDSGLHWGRTPLSPSTFLPRNED
jgi:hypothetical protein